jgi:hypothetical protein
MRILGRGLAAPLYGRNLAAAVLLGPRTSNLHTQGTVRSYAQVDAEVSELQPQVPAQRHRREDG